MSTEAHVVITDLSKHYHRGQETVTAFEGLDLTIDRGQVTAIVGPSGSGKSTLLTCLAGIDSPNSGSLVVNGEDIAAYKPAQRDRWRSSAVGLVFQSFNLIDVLDARSNVLLGLAGRRPTAEDKARADALLERVGLADRARHRPDQLSGGQQQRVAIARALIHQPPLILADEPTGNLDADGAVSVTELFLSLAKEEGTTVIIVTHDPRLAEAADHTYTLDKGKLVGAAA